MSGSDRSRFFQESIKGAQQNRTVLNISGGGSKVFYGGAINGQPLSTLEHHGIVNYHPTELVITARAGTALNEVEQVLAEQGQMLAFEPPQFAGSATLGGAIAAGLSGSRRPFTGAARDFVLGCRMIDGKGQILNFGGEVMKNVAGYDVSRLMAGSMGTLGLILQVSIKVLPKPQHEQTRQLAMSPIAARRKMLDLACTSLPLSAMSFDGSVLRIRLSGAEKAVLEAASRVGGEQQEDDIGYWACLNAQRLAFFSTDLPLWRIAVPPATEDLPLTGETYQDWGGGLRWLKSNEPAGKVFAAADKVQGHATLFRATNKGDEVFQPQPAELQNIQRQLKRTFDPDGLFNPFRLNRNW